MPQNINEGENENDSKGMGEIPLYQASQGPWVSPPLSGAGLKDLEHKQIKKMAYLHPPDAHANVHARTHARTHTDTDTDTDTQTLTHARTHAQSLGKTRI